MNVKNIFEVGSCVDGCSFSVHIRRNGSLRKATYISFVLLTLLIMCTLCPVYFVPNSTEAAGSGDVPELDYEANSSTASVSLDVVNKSGSFASSTSSGRNVSFKLRTNNATGYTLNLKASSAVLSDGTNTINSISSNGITSSSFTKNTWGIIPSKYNSTNNTTKYYKASVAGFKMDETSVANTDNNYNEYTVGLGLKADFDTPAGTYVNSTLIVEYVANPVTFSVAYKKNTTDTVTNLPQTQSGSMPQNGTYSINLSSDIPVRAGYSFLGWCLGTASSSNVVTVNENDVCNNATINQYSAGELFKIDFTSTSGDYYLYAMWQNKVRTATIYYNVGTGNASAAINNTVVSCTITSGTSCVANIPEDVRSSIGQYGSAFVGLASATNTMSKTNNVNSNNTNITLSENGDNYYGLYSSPVTIHKASSFDTVTTVTVYRNQWFVSNASLSVPTITTSVTSTEMYEYVSSIIDPDTNLEQENKQYSLFGFRESYGDNHSSECRSIGNACNNVTAIGYSSASEYYAIERLGVNGKLYYQGSNEMGITEIKYVSLVNGRYRFFATADTLTTHNNQFYGEIPEEIANSVGTYNTPFAGMTSITNHFGNTTPTTASDKWYAYYADPAGNPSLTIVKPRNNSTITEVSLYRNQYFVNTTTISDVLLSTISMGSEWTYNTGAGTGLLGFSLSDNSTSLANSCKIHIGDSASSICSTTGALANSNISTAYAIETVPVNATFYYNNNTNTVSCTTANVTSVVGTGYRYLYPNGTTVDAKDNTFAVPEVVRTSKGTCGMNFRTVNRNPTVTTSETPNTADENAIYYARYSQSISYHYNTGGGLTYPRLYRNQYVNGTAVDSLSAITLSFNVTGSSNNYNPTNPSNPEIGPGGTVWLGVATTSTAEPEFTSMAEAATANVVYTNLYAVYGDTVSYSVNGYDGTYYLTKTGSSYNLPSTVTINDESINVVGWATVNGNTVTVRSGSYTPAANDGDLYAFTDTLYIYVNTDGSAGNSGLIEDGEGLDGLALAGTRMRSVANAISGIISAEIKVGAGNYDNQHLYFDNSNSNIGSVTRITISGAGNCAGQNIDFLNNTENLDECTVFKLDPDGDDIQGFMKVDEVVGAKATFEVKGFVIAGYLGGINFDGVNNSNISYVTFYKMGSAYRNYLKEIKYSKTPNGEKTETIYQKSYGTAVIALQHSTHIIIDHCRFEEIKNDATPENNIGGRVVVNSDGTLKSQTDDALHHLIHAVYFAHEAVRNKVFNNYFVNIGSDPIDFRDDSHNNFVYRNTFENTGTRTYVVSYYNSSSNENKSDRNFFAYNILKGGHNFSDGLYPSSNHDERNKVCVFHDDNADSELYAYDNIFRYKGSSSDTSESLVASSYDFPKNSSEPNSSCKVPRTDSNFNLQSFDEASPTTFSDANW